MATAQEMQAYADYLSQHTISLNIPVTEIAILKLIPTANDETKAILKRDFIDATTHGEGIRRFSWGYSLDDPLTLILMYDWRMIQDHWAFWQTPAFERVSYAISTCLQPGRPLVRHYKFEPPEMLPHQFVQLLAWNEGEEKSAEETIGKVESKGKNWLDSRVGYAVDMNEMTWCSVLLGYNSEADARADQMKPRGETHLIKLEHHVARG